MNKYNKKSKFKMILAQRTNSNFNCNGNLMKANKLAIPTMPQIYSKILRYLKIYNNNKLIKIYK